MGASGPRRWTFAAGLGPSSFPHLPHPPTHFPPLSLRHLLSHLPLIELSSSFLTTLFIKIKELNVLTFFFPFSQVFISWETKLSCWTCVWPRGHAPWQPPRPCPSPWCPQRGDGAPVLPPGGMRIEVPAATWPVMRKGPCSVLPIPHPVYKTGVPEPIQQGPDPALGQAWGLCRGFGGTG